MSAEIQKDNIELNKKTEGIFYIKRNSIPKIKIIAEREIESVPEISNSYMETKKVRDSSEVKRFFETYARRNNRS